MLNKEDIPLASFFFNFFFFLLYLEILDEKKNSFCKILTLIFLENWIEIRFVGQGRQLKIEQKKYSRKVQKHKNYKIIICSKPTKIFQKPRKNFKSQEKKNFKSQEKISKAKKKISKAKKKFQKPRKIIFQSQEKNFKSQEKISKAKKKFQM